MIKYICDGCGRDTHAAYKLQIEGGLDWIKKELCRSCADQVHVLITVWLDTEIERGDAISEEDPQPDSGQ